MSSPLIPITLTLGALALASPAMAAPPAGRALTLEQAIQAALEGNIGVVLAREQIVSAQTQVDEAKARRLPSLAVRGNLFAWNEKQAVDFGGAELTIREQVTGNVSLVVTQPISGAVALSKLVSINRTSVEMDRARLDEQRLDVAYQVAQTYLGGLQAETLATIARASIAQLDANLANATIRQKLGALGEVDVLRLRASRAAAEQRMLDAQTQADTARATLALQLGARAGTELALVEIDASPPQLPDDVSTAIADSSARPGLRVAQLSEQQARLGIDAARIDYLPQLSLVFDFSHAINAGALAPTANTAYLGLALDWNLWDWGRRKAVVARARSSHRQAAAQAQFTRDQVAVDVRTRWLAARNARASVTVSEPGLAAAEEAYRLETVRFEQGAATTNDVLDAELAVTTARSQAAIARYQYLLAWMALARATGEVPHA